MDATGKRAWQRMLSGRRLDILDPSPLDIEIEDVARGLSRQPRWNGQTHGEHAFSVAQHSLLVAELMATVQPHLPPTALLAGLLHDAAEFVTADLVTPFKRAVGKPYRDIEARVRFAVHLAFRLPADLPPHWDQAIGAADRTAAYLEAVHLAGFQPDEARAVLGFRGAAPEVMIEPWGCERAHQTFLAVFHDLADGGMSCLRRWRAAA